MRLGALSCAALLLACAGASGPHETAPTGTTEPTAPAASASPSATAASPTSSASVAPTAAPTASPSTAPPEPAAKGPLATFHNALSALKRGERKDHVRIIWLGDSHAQADLWTHEIRTGLQQRYGVGGPGFIRIGYRQYRHSSAKVKVDGSWRMRPKSPATSKPYKDGTFGLGGILHAGYAGMRRARLTLRDESLTDKKWSAELCYKFGLAYDEFKWSVGDQEQTFKASAEQVGKLRYTRASGSGLATLQVKPMGGRPDFCGVVIETDPAGGPGVVLDNLGINGARYATALAWNEQAWAEAVKRRPPPELFVFEFGGNEASDLVVQAESYKSNALALIARARAIRADASCLVIGPADRVDAETRIPPIVEAMKAAAAEAGCAFWDTYDKMGGKGSLRKWRDENKAAPDGVHLKPNGYKVLGEWLLKDLLPKPNP